MWKLTVKYSDGGKAQIIGKGKSISLVLAKEYYNQFRLMNSDRTAIYQEYPLKDNEPMSLIEKIEQLRANEV